MSMNKLEEREAKRKQSVVRAIISEQQQEEEEIKSPSAYEMAEKQANNLGLQSLFVVPKGKEETKSKRVNLLIKPSVYETAKRQCDSLDISLNECINQLLENWIAVQK